MHHAYKFGKSHSSGLKQNVEDFWNAMGKPQKFDPHQAHDFFTRLMREGRADEVNAVHQRAGENGRPSETWCATTQDTEAFHPQSGRGQPLAQLTIMSQRPGLVPTRWRWQVRQAAQANASKKLTLS